MHIAEAETEEKKTESSSNLTMEFLEKYGI